MSSCCYCQPEAGQGSPFQVGSVAALYTAALVLVAFVGSHRLGTTEEDAFWLENLGLDGKNVLAMVLCS